MKILMSNLGYLRGISGSLTHHILFAYRHFYCSAVVQEKVWRQLAEIMSRERPDLCCFVEIEQAAFHKANFCLLEGITGETYPFFDIENKYLNTSPLRSFPLTRGKSNAFLSKQDLPYKKIHFTCGTKRLIYKIGLTSEVTLFFTHFSLNKKVRKRQLLEAGQMVKNTPGEVIFLGDFNILSGFKELAPLLQNGELVLLNRKEHKTFTFHVFHKVLDICLCTKNIAHQCNLQVIPQPYSDHDALLLEIK
ncbi:MAG: endonuclease/exonuclease/phosphatase family protein [Alphaproteobacteria bacterium]|nr:endonuclease/exonuclease/phosphatase family protein [Alphaproteobacteria bacterium]